MVLRKNLESFLVVYPCWSDLKCRDIALQRDQGMNLEAKISLFFGRILPVVCPICTESMAITHTPKLADRKGKAVNYKITAGCYGKELG